MAKIQKKSLDSSPDETRTFEKGKIELANLGDVYNRSSSIGTRLELGKMCETNCKNRQLSSTHTQYIISGRIKVVMDDGAEEEFGPGDAAVIPPGHNAWVVGDESVVGIDFTGLKEYAKS